MQTAWMGATASKEVSKASRTRTARIGAALTVRKSELSVPSTDFRHPSARGGTARVLI